MPTTIQLQEAYYARELDSALRHTLACLSDAINTLQVIQNKYGGSGEPLLPQVAAFQASLANQQTNLLTAITNYELNNAALLAFVQ